MIYYNNKRRIETDHLNKYKNELNDKGENWEKLTIYIRDKVLISQIQMTTQNGEGKD